MPRRIRSRSRRKTYTARTFRAPSGEIAKRVKDNPTLGLVHLRDIIALQGALPIKVGDDVVGAVGVSERPAATRTRLAPRPGSTRSPIG